VRRDPGKRLGATAARKPTWHSGASECDTYRPFRSRPAGTSVQWLAASRLEEHPLLNLVPLGAASCEHDSLGESCPGRSVPGY
jgi:hypothetical protein